MLEKIKDIRKSIENECYLSALALALTIPDICGQIEYPELKKKNGQRLVKQQYVKWFREWVSHYYSYGSIESNGTIFCVPKDPFFTGEMCYDLRCDFLHSGGSNISDYGDKEDEDYEYSYKFNLIVNGYDSFGEDCWITPQLENKKILKDKLVSIDIINLCNFMCESAERYYNQKDDESLFDEHSINVVDIRTKQKELEK